MISFMRRLAGGIVRWGREKMYSVPVFILAFVMVVSVRVLTSWAADSYWPDLQMYENTGGMQTFSLMNTDTGKLLADPARARTGLTGFRYGSRHRSQ